MKWQEEDVVGKVISIGPWEETCVYRYLPVDRFLEIVETRKNTLVHISKWEDPNEAYLIRARIAAAGNGDDIQRWYDKYRMFYAQSWTFNGEESDVLWRAYGKRGDTVRIKTSLRKLENTLFQFVGEKKTGYDLSAYIGPISYVDDLREVLPVGDGDVVRTLFVKGNRFRDEKEFRVVVKLDDAESTDEKNDRLVSTAGGLLKCEVNVSELIQSVLVDPCCPQGRLDEIRCRVMNAWKGDAIEIQKSDLFEWPSAVASPKACVSKADNDQTVQFGESQRKSPSESEFWLAFARKYRGGKSEFSGKDLPTRRYWGFPIGNGMSYYVTFNRSCARVELYIDSANANWNKRVCKEMEKKLQTSNPTFKFDDLKDKRAARVSLENNKLRFTDRDKWNDALDWLCTNLDSFRSVMEKAIEDMV